MFWIFLGKENCKVNQLDMGTKKTNKTVVVTIQGQVKQQEQNQMTNI